MTIEGLLVGRHITQYEYNKIQQASDRTLNILAAAVIPYDLPS